MQVPPSPLGAPPPLEYPSPPSDIPVSPSRKWLVLMVLLLGVVATLYFEVHSALFSPRKGFVPSRRSILVLLQKLAPIALAGILCAIPAVRKNLSAFLDRIANPSPAKRRAATLAIAIAAALYFLFTATWQNRDLSVRQQDESMYLTQTQMLARGHLWMPQHPQADFFETFHILVKPLYAPIYFPGTALAYAPSIWLHIRPWFWAILIAGAGVGMTYRVITEMLDGVAGILAAMLVAASIIFRHLSTMVMSHPLLMLLALLMTWSFLRWRRNHHLGFACLCGLFAGWAAITRPVDALAYAIPLLAAVVWEMRKSPWQRWLLTALVVVAGAAPLIALQFILDVGVTGHLLQTPVTMYHQRYWPEVTIGFSGDLTHYHPSTSLLEFQQYYDNYILPSFKEFSQTPALKLLATARLPLLMSVALPSLLLAALMPLSLLELRPPRRWALVLAFPLFLAGYATFMFFRRHYGIVIFPPIFLAVLLGAKAVERTWPRHRAAWKSFVALSITGLCLAILPELNPNIRDQQEPTPILTALNKAIRHLDHKPALIMIRHTPGNKDWSQEPVYNVDVPWPDDAPAIRAHDLGKRNIELYRYYAKQNPQRAVYGFDKSKPQRGLKYWGTVAELAKSKQPSPP